MRRKLSGHWGGNDSIEKVYGRSLRKRKDKILEYILDGYKPGSDKVFNDRGQQTEISLMEDTTTIYRKDSPPTSPDDNSEKPISKGPSKNSKKVLSEIHLNYEKKRLNCNVFYLLKKRRLQIPLKSIKRQSVRIVIAPPFMELYLGQDQIFPFDLKNVLAQKQKCPFEEIRTEGIQRMPDVITLRPEHESRYAEFRHDLPRTGVTVLETADDEDIVFHDRYDYLPIGIQNKRTKTAFNFKKLTYVEPTYMKCLQKNLTNINHPERFINESDILENTKYFTYNKPSLGKHIKSFISGLQPSEITRIKSGTSLVDDVQPRETFNVPSSENIETMLSSSKPSVISCIRTYDSCASPSTASRNVSHDKLLESDVIGVPLQSNILTGTEPGAKRSRRLQAEGASSTDNQESHKKHKYLKSSLKRRLTEGFVDYTSEVSITKGLLQSKKRLMDNLWPKKAEINSSIKTVDLSKTRATRESRETIKDRILLNKPGCESATTLISFASDIDKSKWHDANDRKLSKEQKLSRSKSILKRGKKSSLRLEEFDRIHKERFYPEESNPKNVKNKEKEHIFANLSLEDKFKQGVKSNEPPTQSNVSSADATRQQSATHEGKNMLELMFGGSLFRHGKDESPDKRMSEASTSKPKSWDKGNEALSSKTDDKNSSLKQEESSYRENSGKSVVFDITSKPNPKKSEFKKTKSSMKSVLSSQYDGLLSSDNYTTDGQSGSQSCSNNGPEYKVLFPLFQAVSSTISSHENNAISSGAQRDYGPDVVDKNVPVQKSDQMSSNLDENSENKTFTLPRESISPKRNRTLNELRRQNE
ncbi:uncharacterized protein LOC106667079 isoform X2 [Cimex lectularius]|nr:uncharacterized protein LOC106667079 isoform X2 [Cimex lectularius]